jgi:heme exporter protein A
MAVFSGHSLACVRSERVVFTRLDFSLQAGGALLLVGPNGSGKSSLLRVMAGLLKPAAGHLAWDGADVADDKDAHGARLHYVGHHDAVKPVLSVAENVRFWAELWADTPGDVATRVAGALDAFAIGHLAEVPGRFLSAGQKRRVNLARIIAAPAPLWLLDEPTTALDKATIAELENLIAAHRSAGGMVVASTHTDIGLDGAATLSMTDFKPAPMTEPEDAA